MCHQYQYGREILIRMVQRHKIRYFIKCLIRKTSSRQFENLECSKGIPNIDDVQVKNDYPSESTKSQKKKIQSQDNHPPECGLSLF